jgi:FkbM family methyltransferase
MRWSPGPSTVSVALPGDGPRASKVVIHRHGGADQIARALDQMGWEGFEAPLPSAVVRILRRWPGVFLDVGANTGFYSLVAVASGPATSAIAFEPVPAILELLRANLRLNRASGRVTVEEVAIGDQSGWATLHLPPPQLDGTVETSASLEPDFKDVVASSFEVRTSTLDDAWRGRGEPPVTMVKVDVEGSEARVLRGAEAVISTCRPVLSIEVLRAEDTGPLEAARAQHRYVDITLAPGRAVICPSVTVDPAAPNHLLVPEERLAAVADELRQIEGVAVIG